MKQYTSVLNRSLEMTADDYIGKDRSCCNNCFRRVCKLLRYILAAVMCAVPPIVIVAVLLVGGSDAPAALDDIRSAKVGREGIETGGGETQPANFTCVGNVSGTISAEPAGSTLDEGRMLDHDRDTPWRSSAIRVADGADEDQPQGWRLRPQQLIIELNDPVSCIEYMDVYWHGRSSASAYNISASGAAGDAVQRQFANLDDSRDRVDTIRLELSGVRRIQLNLLAPVGADSYDVFHYEIRELELLGFRDDLEAGGSSPDTSCARRWRSDNSTEGIVNASNASTLQIQQVGSLVNRSSLLVLENCTSNGGPKYSWGRVLKVAAEVGLPWTVIIFVLCGMYVFRHTLQSCCRTVAERVGEQHSLRRATSRASYKGRFNVIKSRADTAVLSEISAGLALSLPILPPPAPVVSASAAAQEGSVVYGRGTAIVTLDSLDDFLKMHIMAWLDCIELVQLCRVCRWWRRLHLQAGHWARVPFASPYWSGHNGRLRLAGFSNLCCIEITPDQCSYELLLGNGGRGGGGGAGGATLGVTTYTTVPTPSGGGACKMLPFEGTSLLQQAATAGATPMEQSASESDGDRSAAAAAAAACNQGQGRRSFSRRAKELLRRNGGEAVDDLGAATSFALSASDLELRRTLMSFRLRGAGESDDRSDSPRRRRNAYSKASGASAVGDDSNCEDNVPPAVWELSDDFVQQLFSRECKLTALELSQSNFNGRLRELKSVQELSLRECHQLDVFTCDPSALPTLQRLDLSGCSRLWDVNGFLNCWTVTEIDLSHCPRLENITPLAACSKLQTLNLSHCEQLREVSVLAALSKLLHLDLSCTTHIDDIKPLSKCTELLSCDISWTSVTDLRPLVKCSKLRVVDAQGCEGLQSEGVAELQRLGSGSGIGRGNGGGLGRVQLTLRPVTSEVLSRRWQQ